jgi:hypothetical protein
MEGKKTFEPNIITGERIQRLCDVYIGTYANFSYNPGIFAERHKHLNVEQIPLKYDNPSVVFCYPTSLDPFLERLDRFKNRFILVTHNSDYNVEDTGKVRCILEHPMVYRWYAQNMCFIHEKLEVLPIGMANRMWPHGNTDYFRKGDDNGSLYELHKNKTEMVYFHFSLHTNQEKRRPCFDALRSRLPFLQSLNPTEYHPLLAKYRYCICPEGNGVDTHRLWEALYLQSIPIVLRTSFTDVLQKKLSIPMIVLDRWEDLFSYSRADLEQMVERISFGFDEEYYRNLLLETYRNRIAIDRITMGL